MKWSLDPLVRAGGAVYVPIVETVVSMTVGKNHVAAHCEKRPALFLMIQENNTRGVDLSGRARDLEDIEREFPGAIKRAQAWNAESAG